MSFLKNYLFGNKNKNNNSETPPTTKIPGKTFLFFIHQNRMKTSVVKTFNELGKYSSNEFSQIDEKTRFYNACIVKLTISATDASGNNQVSLSLKYNGDTSAEKKNKLYWVTPDTPDSVKEILNIINRPNAKRIEENPNEINSTGGEYVNEVKSKVIFTTRNIVIPNENLKQILHLKTNIEAPITCYFVRHGVATHNDETKYIKYEINTELVDKNDSNIITAGEKFSEINNNIDAIFVSDLIRTHQTATLFLSGYSKKNTIPDKVHVLPCLHELNKSAEDGEFQLLAYYENKTNCRNKKDLDEWEKTFGRRFSTRGKKLCDEITIAGKERPIPLDWDFYKKFYNYYRDDSTRIRKTFNYLTKKLSFSNNNNADNNDKINEEINADNQLCRDNHFLGLAFDIVNTPPTGGKPKITTRKARKSQKPRKSRKSTR
jgi:hypothetical protein